MSLAVSVAAWSYFFFFRIVLGSKEILPNRKLSKIGMDEESDSTSQRTAPRPLFWVGLFLALVLGIFAMRFFRPREESPSVSQDYVKKLAIEVPGKVVVAPNFSLKTVSAQAISLKQLRGKVVFLNFWATWCAPCRQEMPAMEKLQQQLKEEGLEVVAVNYRESEKQIAPFLKDLGLTFTVLLDEDGSVSEKYGVWGLPLSYVVNRKGDFVGKVSGSRDWDSPEARLFFRELLQKKD